MNSIPGQGQEGRLDYRSALDTLFCSVLMLYGNGNIAYSNDSTKRLLVASNTDLNELLSLVRNQIDLAKGSGRYSIETTKNTVICNVYPWFSDGVRVGSTLILHVARHTHCITQEAELADNLLQEISIFIESAYDAFMVTDSKGKIIRVNAALERALSANRRDLMGRYVADLVAEGLYAPSAVLQVIETDKIANAVIEKDNKKLFVTANPVYDSPGNLASVVANIRDMTELDELRRELERQQIMAEAYSRELANLNNQKSATGFVAHSTDMQKIMHTISAISAVDSTVLITGESGVGKEVIVNQIYRTSNRNGKPIIKINCGAIPNALFESEFFGYEPGAFTGAKKQGKPGYFELADGGTLFLDEVGELSVEAQTKLLRVIQEGEITRVGGSKTIQVDVRLIAATNRDLWARVQGGDFRQDLYYRLNVISIDVPPLRNRRDDIVPLAMFFLDKYNTKYAKDKQLSLDLAKEIRALDWNGNIRELENFIENMVVLAAEQTLMPCHLPPRYRQQDAASRTGVVVSGILPLKEALQKTETQLLRNAKEVFQTTTEIAKALKVDQSTISRKLRQLL